MLSRKEVEQVKKHAFGSAELVRQLISDWEQMNEICKLTLLTLNHIKKLQDGSSVEKEQLKRINMLLSRGAKSTYHKDKR